MIPSDTVCVLGISFLKSHCIVIRLFLFYNLILWAWWYSWKRTGPVSNGSRHDGPCNLCPQEPGGVQICRCSLLVALSYLWNFCMIFLSWSKLLSSLSAAGVLGACVFVCFGPRPLGMRVGYEVHGSGVAPCSVQKNVASEQRCLGLSQKETSQTLAWGKAVRVRVMTSCATGDETSWKPVSRARKSAGLKPSRFILSPLLLNSDCPLCCFNRYLPSLLRS